MILLGSPLGSFTSSSGTVVSDDDAVTYCSGFVNNQADVPACVAAIQAGNDPSYLNNQAGSGGAGSIFNWFTGGPSAPTPTQAQAAASGSGSTPWYQSIATGLVTGLLPSGQKAPTVMVAPPAPWYTTPMGIGGLAIGALALYFLVKK